MKITEIKWENGKRYYATYEEYGEVYFVAEDERYLISEHTGDPIEDEFYMNQIAEMDFEELSDEE